MPATYGTAPVAAAIDHDGDMATALVILPAGTYRAAAFIEAGRALGVDLIVASDEKPPLSDPDAFVHIDCERPYESARSIVAAAAGRPVDVILPVDDAGVMIAALAADELGLPHSPPDAVAATRNKAMQRRLLAEAEIPQPSFELIGVGDDAVALAEYIGGPVVVKPLSLSAGRGVIRVDHPLLAPPAVESVRQILIGAGRNPNEPVLVEQYIPGVEVAVEGLVDGGSLEILAIFDKPHSSTGPYFPETMLITPSRLDADMQVEIERVTAAAVRALGLRSGPIHAELRVNAGSAYLIEIAARSIGGLCSRALRFGLLGTSLETLLLRNALQIGTVTDREAMASGVFMLPVPTAGILERVEGVEQVRDMEAIVGVEITVPPGRHVLPLPFGDRYVGFVFSKADTAAEVQRALEAAIARLEIVIAAG